MTMYDVLCSNKTLTVEKKQTEKAFKILIKSNATISTTAPLKKYF